ncbi:hypothetical protein QYE76_019155 [Lolium multiflorum]|uniref:F-box domain-containing protein n=1 Tax=Lolium multiflorum TaxID=4521 RepID=A0AAD8VR00_LOLMU|nr:hypothetical protein QYE76_019155 [Lolium multiflorum]
MPPSVVAPLPDELLEEVFLRLPPDEPECLVRASLASKLWLDTLSGPRFGGLYRKFHGAPPMLGFIYCPPIYSSGGYRRDEYDRVPYYEPATKFRARIPDDDWGCWFYEPWDCRHGRVLLVDATALAAEGLAAKFLVWNPLTGSRRELDGPQARDIVESQSLRAAVICAAPRCDHRACEDGPFRVVLVTLDKSDVDCVACAYISLPQMGEGSKPCSGLSLADEWTELSADLDLVGVSARIDFKPQVLIEDALYFVVKNGDSDVPIAILKCDLASNCLSLIDVPPLETGAEGDSETILMATEDGSLGFARLDMLNLHMWSRQMGFDGVLSWTQHRVVNLKELLPIENPKLRLTLVGSVEGSDTIFVTTDLGIYGISLKSRSVKKLWKREIFHYLMPYMSFYTPREMVNPANATH